MNKLLLLPKLSFMGIRKNGSTYGPYIMAGIFSVFVFFVFASIRSNDIVDILPHSVYALMLLTIGQVLLGIILLPFIVYTNSFLIKRRKKELGLYSVLGLDKKHIAFMMLCETLIIFAIVMLGGIIFGLVFLKACIPCIAQHVRAARDCLLHIQPQCIQPDLLLFPGCIRGHSGNECGPCFQNESQ
jgi:putative ABC transport system permease protein